MVIDQLITFYKPNKKVSNEKMMDYLIPRTKHPLGSDANYVAHLVIVYVYSKKMTHDHG